MRRFLCVLLFCGGCAGGGYFGEDYIGVKYIRDPLGEEKLPDTDPLIRFDAFDCTTFVETVLADGDQAELSKIRYAHGVPDFTERNHFIETDWIENNSSIIENISDKIAPTEIYTVIIDKKNWFKKMHNIDTNFAPRTVDLEYIPYKYAHGIRVERPIVVLFLRSNPKLCDKIGTDLAVRHMGFLLPNGRLRHASRRAGHVVDVDFDEYIDQMLENENNLGIITLEIKK